MQGFAGFKNLSVNVSRKRAIMIASKAPTEMLGLLILREPIRIARACGLAMTEEVRIATACGLAMTQSLSQPAADSSLYTREPRAERSRI